MLPSTNIPQLLSDSHHINQASEGQCDCACVATVPTKHQVATFSVNKQYTLNPSLYTFPIHDHYHASLTDYVTSVVVLNNHALEVVKHFQRPHKLTDIPHKWSQMWGDTSVHTALSQMVNFRLLVPNQYTTLPLIETPTTLSAWLHITDRCNLRCAYCYLPHRQQDMSVDTGKDAIEATFRSALNQKYRQVKFKYAGGEPLLRFPVISELHCHARKLAQQHKVMLDGIILSNGSLLTPEILETMQSLDLRLMISLDGLDDAHDSQRFYANGNGSFEDVVYGIELALSYGIMPDISITVSSRNANKLPELMIWILERNLPFSLNFYRENDYSAIHYDLAIEEEKIINGMLAAFKIIESNLPCRSLLASLLDRANLSSPHLRTCGVGYSYLVFDYQGRVSKCQMQLHQPITNAHVYDPLTVIQTDQTGIQNISVEEKEGCQSCRWKYWCTGGCPLTTYRASGKFNIKSPNCHIYQTLLPEIIRLEGLRILKYVNFDEILA